MRNNKSTFKEGDTINSHPSEPGVLSDLFRKDAKAEISEFADNGELRATELELRATERELRAKFSQDELDVFNTVRNIAAFGSLVREARRERRFTQKELSNVAGISRSAIAAIESGVVPGGPRIATIDRLLRACGKQLVPQAIDLDVVIHKPGTVRRLAREYLDASESTSSPCVVLSYSNASGLKSGISDVSRQQNESSKFPSPGAPGDKRSPS